MAREKQMTSETRSHIEYLINTKYYSTSSTP